MLHARVLLVVLGLAAGCSLVLDTSPPDPQGSGPAPDGGVRCDDQADCDDGDACTGVETCVARVCRPGTPVTCASDGCLVGVCDPETGACSKHASQDACDDGIGCTEDACLDDGACSHRPKDSVCDDALGCTRDVCVGTPIAGNAPGCLHIPDDSLCEQPNVPNACATYACAPAAREPGDANGCVPRIAPVCDAGKRCNLETFQCEWLPDGCTGCDDGVACNGVEVCEGGACRTYLPACTDDGSGCTGRVCNLSADLPACIEVRRISPSCVSVSP